MFVCAWSFMGLLLTALGVALLACGHSVVAASALGGAFTFFAELAIDWWRNRRQADLDGGET